MPQYWSQTNHRFLVQAENSVEASLVLDCFWKAVMRYDQDAAEAYLASGQITIDSSITAVLPEGIKFTAGQLHEK